MIKLEQVSTEKLIASIKYAQFDESKTDIANCYNLLMDYNITNFQELRDLIESGHQDFQCAFFKGALMDTEYCLLIANYNDREIEIYPPIDYNDSISDKEVLNYTDLSTNGTVLLIGNPLIHNNLQKGAISNYSVYALKQMLNSVVVGPKSVNNALIGTIKQMGTNGVLGIRNAINLYTSQVERVYYEYKYLRKANLEHINLFSIDEQLKLKLAEKQIDEILLYLLDNGHQFIWGSLSDNQKKTLRSALEGNNNRKAIIARECMINIISNYTTLGELEEGIVRTRVINRFIR